MAKNSKQNNRRVKLGIPNSNKTSQYCFGGLHVSVGNPARDLVSEAFMQIVFSLCKRQKGFVREHDKQLFPCSYCLWEVGLFEQDVPDKLRRLWQAIQVAVDQSYQSGLEDGASLLKQLASGTTSIQEYNEATLGRTNGMGDNDLYDSGRG